MFTCLSVYQLEHTRFSYFVFVSSTTYRLKVTLISLILIERLKVVVDLEWKDG